MKLTIDKVREVLADLERGVPPRTSTIGELCNDWLARHTVRWGDSGPFESAVLRGPGFLGVVAFNGEDWGASLDDVDWFVAGAGEAEARAWLEEQARAAGFEVAT